MTASLVYLDSSAIVKLVVREPESTALYESLEAWPERVSSAIARVEVVRAIRRAGSTETVRHRALEVLARIALIDVDRPVLDAASEIEPRDLRSLDAIHLATALSLRGDLAGLVTYADRLAAAAARLRLAVWAPA